MVGCIEVSNQLVFAVTQSGLLRIYDVSNDKTVVSPDWLCSAGYIKLWHSCSSLEGLQIGCS